MESFPIGLRADENTPGAEFYRVFSKALELNEAPSGEEDAEFWEAICAMGLIAWNISYKDGTAQELEERLVKEYEIACMPPAFSTIIRSIIEDRRIMCAEESVKIKDCRIENGHIIVEY